MKKPEDYQQLDREIWQDELEDFVPKKLFDAHVHIWDEAHAGSSDQDFILRLGVDFEGLNRWSAQVFPDREIHYHLLGSPVPGMDVNGHNNWLASEAEKDVSSFASMVVTPGMSGEQIAGQIEKSGFTGLKPYRLFTEDAVNCRIRDYLPEPQIEVADHFGLVVTLHLSKPSGIADPENQHDLKELTHKYPNVKWLLAHFARGFNNFMLKDSIHFLKELPNIWYDTSGVNDLYSHILVLKHENRKRILFGSDNVAAGCMRGKYITYGRVWEGYRGSSGLEHCDAVPTLVTYEELRQLRQTADILELNQNDINDIFFNNARQLFDLSLLSG